jgi:hypothetical protein
VQHDGLSPGASVRCFHQGGQLLLKDPSVVAGKKEVLEEFYKENFAFQIDSASYGIGYLAALRWVLSDSD